MPEHSVYLVRTQEYHKIGYASNFKNRLSTLRAGCPTPIELVHLWELSSGDDARYAEKKLHALHRKNRVTGEWFRFSSEEVDYFKSLDLEEILEKRWTLDLDFLAQCKSQVVDRSDLKKFTKGLFKRSSYTNTDLVRGRKYVSYSSLSDANSLFSIEKVLRSMGFSLDPLVRDGEAQKGKFVVSPNVQLAA